MAIISGDDRDDDLSSENAGDVLLGMGGDDTLQAGADNITLDGGADNDYLFSIGNGTTFIGGAGNDVLEGLGTNDVFKYSFDFEQGGETSSFTEFFARHGGAVVNTIVDGVVVDREVANGTSQGQFSSLYTQWLESLGLTVVDLGQNNSDSSGTPVIENMTGEFGDRESFMAKTGKTSHERFYSDTWSSGGGDGSVTSTDGHDTILEFTSGEDKLDFSGIGLEQFSEELFDVAFGQDVNGDSQADTVITIDGYTGWSLTLSGVSADLLANPSAFINFS